MKLTPVISIVSPRPLTAEGFSSILREQVSKTDIFYSATNFLNWYEHNSAETDIVIIDSDIGVLIAEMMAWELCLKRQDIKILVLASETDSFSSKSFLYSGVKGVLDRDAFPAEIIAAVSKIWDNDHYFSPGIQYKLLQAILSRQKYTETLRKDYNLSENEMITIRMIYAGKKSKAIALSLSLSQRTVEGMRSKILRKLRLENAAGLLLFGLKHHLLDANDVKAVV